MGMGRTPNAGGGATKAENRPAWASGRWNPAGCWYIAFLLKCLAGSGPPLVKWVAFRGQAGIDPVTFFNTRTKQGDRKSSGFWHLQATAVFHGRRFWRLMSWHITLDVTGHWPLCSFSSLEWCSRLPAWPKGHWGPYQSSGAMQLITLKHTQVALTRHGEEQIRFLGFSPGTASGQRFLILKAALHGRSA